MKKYRCPRKKEKQTKMTNKKQNKKYPKISKKK